MFSNCKEETYFSVHDYPDGLTAKIFAVKLLDSSLGIFAGQVFKNTV